MTVKGRTVRHCHGAGKGKKIKTHRTRGAARRQHRAIQAGKRK